MRKILVLLSFALALPAFGQTNLYNPATAHNNAYFAGDGQYHTLGSTAYYTTDPIVANAGGYMISNQSVNGAQVTDASGNETDLSNPTASGQPWAACTPIAIPATATHAYFLTQTDPNATAIYNGSTCPNPAFTAYVAPALAATVITIPPVADKLFSSAPFNIGVSVNTNNTVQAGQYVTGPATIAPGGLITLTRQNGVVTYTWTQPADGTHAAGSASTTFNVYGAPRTAGFVTVFATAILDTTGSAASNATLCATPSNSVRLGGGGLTTIAQVCTPVTNGAASLPLPDTSLAYPQNAPCEAITITDNETGADLLGPGYSCVQPTSAAGSTWCSNLGCDLDLYPVSLPSLALSAAGSVGATGATGASGISAVRTITASGTQALAMADGNTVYDVTLTGNTSFTITPASSDGYPQHMTLVIHPATFTATLPGSSSGIAWFGGLPPTVSTTGTTAISFLYDGTLPVLAGSAN